MNQSYATNPTSVGTEGRLLLERAAQALVIAGGHSQQSKQISALVHFLKEKEVLQGVVLKAAKQLQRFGNRSSHDNLKDIKNEEKPYIVVAALTVAEFVLREISESKYTLGDISWWVR